MKLSATALLQAMPDFPLKPHNVKEPAARPGENSRNTPKPILNGGGERSRTDDPLLAKQALSQLSYTPIFNYLSAIYTSRWWA